MVDIFGSISREHRALAVYENDHRQPCWILRDLYETSSGCWTRKRAARREEKGERIPSWLCRCVANCRRPSTDVLLETFRDLFQLLLDLVEPRALSLRGFFASRLFLVFRWYWMNGNIKRANSESPSRSRANSWYAKWSIRWGFHGSQNIIGSMCAISAPTSVSGSCRNYD